MNKGFTLLELLIVIILLGVLAALISGNFVTSLKKGRDAARKTDLEQIQKALETYYEDNKVYPPSITFGGQLCHPSGCSTSTYMQKVPKDSVSSLNYQYCVDSSSTPTKYQLYTHLENSNDPKIISPTKLSDSGGSCTADCPTCNYGISSVNITP